MKWDGVRALVSTEDGLGVRSRRGWDMTGRLPELGKLVLCEATATLGLESVVAKRRSEQYRPGERGCVKTKHRTYWRFGQELESAQRGAGNG